MKNKIMETINTSGENNVVNKNKKPLKNFFLWLITVLLLYIVIVALYEVDKRATGISLSLGLLIFATVFIKRVFSRRKFQERQEKNGIKIPKFQSQDRFSFNLSIILFVATALSLLSRFADETLGEAKTVFTTGILMSFLFAVILFALSYVSKENKVKIAVYVGIAEVVFILGFSFLPNVMNYIPMNYDPIFLTIALIFFMAKYAFDGIRLSIPSRNMAVAGFLLNFISAVAYVGSVLFMSLIWSPSFISFSCTITGIVVFAVVIKKFLKALKGVSLPARVTEGK